MQLFPYLIRSQVRSIELVNHCLTGSGVASESKGVHFANDDTDHHSFAELSYQIHNVSNIIYDDRLTIFSTSCQWYSVRYIRAVQRQFSAKNSSEASTARCFGRESSHPDH